MKLPVYLLRLCLIICTTSLFISSSVAGQAFDSSFTKNGLYQSYSSSEEKYVEAIASQADGKVMLLNSFVTSNTANLIRLTSSGTVDSGFGTNGVVPIQVPAGYTINYGALDIYTDVKIASNKLIYAATRVYVADSGSTTLIGCYNPNGTLHTAFGKNGFAQVQLYYGAKLAIDTSGRIYAGSSNVFVRLLSTGALDNSFGTNGYSTQPAANGFLLKPLPGGKLLVYGYNYMNGIGVVRLKANGSLDSSFGTNGRISLQPANGSTFVEAPVDLIIKNNKSILIQCLRSSAANANKTYTSFYQTDFNGHLDASFGTAGNAISPTIQFPKCVNFVPGSQFISTAAYKQAGINYVTFTRYSANGKIDSSYATNGVLTYSQKALGIPNLNIISHEQGSNARLYLGGDNYASGTYSLGVTRFTYQSASPAVVSSRSATATMASLPTKGSMSLSPNPARDYITVGGLTGSAASSLYITDATGKIKLRAMANGAGYRWNISSLNGGIYYLTIVQNNVTQTVKFVKLLSGMAGIKTRQDPGSVRGLFTKLSSS